MNQMPASLFVLQFKALRIIGINKNYITVLEDMYTGGTARVDVDDQVSEKIPSLRGRKTQFLLNYPQRQFRRSLDKPARRETNEYRWRKTVGPKIWR